MFIKNRLGEEDRVCGIRSVEDLNAKIDEIGLFFRDYDKDYHAK